MKLSIESNGLHCACCPLILGFCPAGGILVVAPMI